MRRADLTGLVLCGGASRRMGTDKATLELQGRTLLQRAVDRLDGVCAEVVLAAGPEPRYADLQREQVVDRYRDAGPLAGLEAGLDRTRTPWMAALACDMPQAEPELFERMLERAAQDRLDACLFESRSGPEPLCGVYSRSCLTSVRAALDAGQRKVLAFESFPTEGGELPKVGWLREAELDEGLRERECAFNVNTPPDLLRARANKRALP